MKFWSNSEVPAAGAIVPEKRLLAAVLQRAVTDFISGTGEIREGAEQWLDDDAETSESPLTFGFICEALDIEKETFRKAIKLQRKKMELELGLTHADSSESDSDESDEEEETSVTQKFSSSSLLEESVAV